MDYTGHIIKMHTTHTKPIRYELMIGENLVCMNDLIKKYIVLKYENEISCIDCGRKTNKSFAQGFCYPCFINSPLTSDCIMKPERCRAHDNSQTSMCTSRDIEWAQNNCLQPQYVYLAISSGVKVGVTRATQIPTRWIDQGASSAIKLACTPNRYLSGAIEVAMKEYVSDKTSWQKMLKNDIVDADLHEVKHTLSNHLSDALKQYIDSDDTIHELEYPVIDYPLKVKSVNFDKQSEVEGRLWGIKGQYLIFDDGRVFNIRRHNGYLVTLET